MTVWTNQEVSHARYLARTLTIRAVANEIGRSYSATYYKIKDVSNKKRKLRWTQKERALAIAMRNYGKPLDEISKELGRTKAAVNSMLMRDPGYDKIFIRKLWKTSEIKEILDMYKTMTAKEISEKLSTSIMSIQSILHRYTAQRKRARYELRAWSSDDVSKLLAYRKRRVKYAAIAKELGRTAGAVNIKLRALRRKGLYG